MRTVHRLGLMTLTALAAAVSIPASSHAQAPAVVDALMRDIDMLEQKLIGLAEAIPEEQYGWRPGEGVRSVGEVMMHVAADNYFIPTIAGVTAPTATGIKAGDYQSVLAYEGRSATKAEAIAATRESFVHLRTAMQAVDDAALGASLNVFGTSMSGLDLWILATTHLHEHLGQMIAYARSNSVVPPWNQGG